MIAALRRDPWLALALLVSMGACILPLWVADLLPFQDLPQHLAAVRTIHDLGDPTLALGRYHVVELGRTQYLSWYLLLDALCYVLPLDVANRLVLSLYVAAVPLSAYALLRALGRDGATALLAAPLALNTYLYMGFANYVVALPMVLWGLAWLIRLQDRWNPKLAVALALLVVLLFYSHVQALLMYLGFAAITSLLRAPGLHPRRWWRPASHVLPTLALLTVWTLRSRILATGKDWAEGHGGRNTTDTKINFEPILRRLEAIPGQLIEVFRDDSDERILLAWLALLLLVALLGERNPSPQPDATQPGDSVWRVLQRLRASLAGKLPVVLLAAGFVVYVLSPISYKWIWPISHRLVPLLGLMLVIAVGFVSMPFRRTLLLLPATLLCLHTGVVHAEHMRRFTAEAGPIHEIMAQAEPGKKLVALIFDSSSRVTRGAPYLHFSQYYVIDRGGMANFSFANMPQSPVIYRQEGGPPTLRPRWEWLPHLFRWEREGRYYDYVLIRGAKRQAELAFGRHMDEVTLVSHVGRWWLYRKK